MFDAREYTYIHNMCRIRVHTVREILRAEYDIHTDSCTDPVVVCPVIDTLLRPERERSSVL